MNVNKQTIITLLLTLVAIAGRAQAFQYRIVGNIGCEFTGWLYLMNQSDKDYSDVDSLWVEDGVIRTFEGNAQEPFLALLHSKGREYKGLLQLYSQHFTTSDLQLQR
jgi:hypothetical protein